MPGSKPLAIPSDIIYTYDGSFDGFLCCVHASVYSRQLPCEILLHDQAPITLLSTIYIETDLEKAGRVLASISQKISPRALSLMQTVFLSCMEEKELSMLRFLLQGYQDGAKLLYQLGNPVTAPLLSAEKHLLGEAHLLKGFIRFADVGGALVSTITPKNYILPFLAPHFIQRYDNEVFMIFDKTHNAALTYDRRQFEIISVDTLDLPPPSEEELGYQALWKQFYDTVAIQGRENPRCRMTHMPKRYWANMLEVRHLL